MNPRDSSVWSCFHFAQGILETGNGAVKRLKAHVKGAETGSVSCCFFTGLTLKTGLPILFKNVRQHLWEQNLDTP